MRSASPTLVRPRWRMSARRCCRCVRGDLEIEPPLAHVDPSQSHGDPRAELVRAARTLPGPGATSSIEDEVIALERRDMHQAIHLQIRQLHEQAKLDHAA